MPTFRIVLRELAGWLTIFGMDERASGPRPAR